MIYPNFKDFKRLSEKYNIIPVYKEILADTDTPVSTFLKLAKDKPYSYLLESVEGGERWARYSFIAWEPKLIFKNKGKNYTFFKYGQKPEWKKSDDPLNELKELMNEFRPYEPKGLPRFFGGAVGYVSYDMVRFFERLPDKPKDKLNFPDSIFLITDKILIFDHLKHSVKLVICADLRKTKNIKSVYSKAVREIQNTENKLNKPLHISPAKHTGRSEIKSNVSKNFFCNSIRKVKEYIRKGDIIQAVYSQRFSRKTNSEAFDIYRSLRLLNPSPYMYFLHLDDFHIIGSSPEILVRKEDNIAETRPIAGTRPRGKNPEDEAALVKDLLSDPKERAEHIMLVDLGRNDLSRVCDSPSVKVPQLMTIEKYSHVIHIVSSVIGKLKPGTDSFDLFKACFPAGTVSGAPKIRAMEIIDELEPEARGPYAGSVGYFSYSGNMDMAITIRTMVLKNKIAYIQAGAGIVADSVPEKEHQESKNKAAALFAAIEAAENSG